MSLYLLPLCLKHFNKKIRKLSLIGKEAPFCICKKGSFTIEAAIVLPLFAGFFVSILFFFRVLQVEQSVEEALQYTGRKMAVCAYEKQGDEMLLDLASAEIIFKQALKDADCPVQYTSCGSVYLDGVQSSFLGNYIELYVNYDMPLPIGFFGNREVSIAQSVKTRKWTGYNGETDVSGNDRFVYVTPTGRVYHNSMDCAYLDLSIQSVSRRELTALRNASGERYRQCELCGKEEGAVYITDYGSCYHSSLSCSGLKRTVYLIRLSEVHGYGACSKCAGD